MYHSGVKIAVLSQLSQFVDMFEKGEVRWLIFMVLKSHPCKYYSHISHSLLKPGIGDELFKISLCSLHKRTRTTLSALICFIVQRKSLPKRQKMLSLISLSGIYAHALSLLFQRTAHIVKSFSKAPPCYLHNVHTENIAFQVYRHW